MRIKRERRLRAWRRGAICVQRFGEVRLGGVCSGQRVDVRVAPERFE